MTFTPSRHDAGAAAPLEEPHAGDRDVKLLLVRANQARTLARCFVYPGPGFAGGLRRSLEALCAAAAPDPPDAEVAARIESLCGACAEADDESIAVEYSRLFIATGGCGLNETFHARQGLTSAAELADIQGFYRAFGFERSADRPEMADHIVSELEFHAALLMKLAYASFRGWDDRREITRDAARRFLEAHLGRWVPAFAGRLRALGAADPYLRAAEAAEAFIAAECRAMGAAPPSLTATIPLSPAEPDAFTCPMAGGCEPEPSPA